MCSALEAKLTAMGVHRSDLRLSVYEVAPAGPAASPRRCGAPGGAGVPPARALGVGAPLWVEGTPFAAAAHEHLQPCVLRGRVSNVIRCSCGGGDVAHSMATADVAHFPGLEGSPVYGGPAGRSPVGIVAPPLLPASQRRPGPVAGAAAAHGCDLAPQGGPPGPPGFLLPCVLPWPAVRDALAAVGAREACEGRAGPGTSGAGARPRPAAWSNVARGAQSRVVSVSAGASWGSGVLVEGDRGALLVATAAHVVAGTDDVGVGGAVQGRGRVAFRAPGIDVALLRVPPPGGLAWGPGPEEREAAVGDECCVVGHGLLPPGATEGPGASFGVVSRVARGAGSGEPVGMVVSARVLPGASGGGVFGAAGELLGIAVGHVAFGGGSHDRVGMAVPVRVVRECCRALRGEAGAFRGLVKVARRGQGFWRLGEGRDDGGDGGRQETGRARL